MSKLDALVNKISKSILSEVRMIVREEIEYALRNGNTKQSPVNENKQRKNENNDKGDYSEVINNFKRQMGGGTGFKMENAIIDGSDGSDVIVDESGNHISTSELANKNPKAKSLAENIANKDYSALL